MSERLNAVMQAIRRTFATSAVHFTNTVKGSGRAVSNASGLIIGVLIVGTAS